MERRPAKELLHIQGWLDRVDEIVERGKDAYHADHWRLELPDPSVRRDQPRAHLADARARSARMEAIARDAVRRGGSNDQ